jgi:hypothetical protein
VVQPQLQKAGQHLGMAEQDLGQGQPMPANQNQGQAVAQLKEALDALNAAVNAGKPSENAQANAQGRKEGSGQEPGQGEGQKPGEGQGQKPGQGKSQGQGQKPGNSQEQNQPKGTGNRLADGRMNDGKSQLTDVKGDGMFLQLPARQRELIRQALNEKLPPEYAALIQQYYINIARGKPAAKPMTPDKR